MNVRNRKSCRRRGQALARTVLGRWNCGCWRARVICCPMAVESRRLSCPAIVMGLLGFSVAALRPCPQHAVNGRRPGMLMPSATVRKSVNPSRHEETLAWAGTN